jgi:DNA-binding GntR family transcriptional regulator
MLALAEPRLFSATTDRAASAFRGDEPWLGELSAMREVVQAHAAGVLPAIVTPQQVVRTLNMGALLAAQALRGLQQLGLAELQARRWRLRGIDGVAESRAFRQAVEPAALTSIHAPRFLADMARKHQRLLDTDPDQETLRTLDLAFHQQLIRLSGNDYLVESVDPLIMKMALGDLRDSCALRRDLTEHLEIMALLQRGDNRSAERLALHLACA